MPPSLITAEQLRAALAWEPIIDAIAEGHREERPLAERVWMEESLNGYLVWHAWAPGSVIVTKMVTVFPGNVHGPSVQAIVAVFDVVTGAPIGLLDGTELTFWKTAAVSALAARYLAPEQPRTLLMVGAGDLAPYLIAAHRAVRPSIERVLVWNRTAAKAIALARRCGGEAVTELDRACAEAQVISCATASETPLVCGADVRPGTHVDLVGGFTPAMRESDDALIAAASVFVDHDGTPPIAGDLTQPAAAGVAFEIFADLFALARGEHRGRRDRDEITVFKSAGGAHLDLFAARHALSVVAARSDDGR